MTLAQNIAHWMFFEGSRLTIESNWTFGPFDIHKKFWVILDDDGYNLVAEELLKNPYVLDVEKVYFGDKIGVDITFSSLFTED